MKRTRNHRDTRATRREALNGEAVSGSKPGSFDHWSLSPTSRESQRRLFASRRKQARNQRNREKRQRVMRVVVFPVLFVSAFVLVVGFSFFRILRTEQEAEAKLNRVEETVTTNESAVPARSTAVPGRASADIEEARDRFLNRDEF